LIVGTLRLRLHLPQARSLKDKRQVVTGLAAKLRNRFGVSVAEVAQQEAWKTAVIGVACVSSSEAVCRRLLAEVTRFAEGAGPFEVVEAGVEIR